MTEPHIVFDRVWKKFHRGQFHDSLRDLIPAFTRRMLGRGPSAAELAEGDFWALRDLSFEVKPGQTLGIIGPNGSGKSTTLKILTKILEPSLGRAEVHGRVGTLIEVSAGFHGDLTGRENIFLQGAIMGMRSKTIERKFDEIVAFSGIEDFIETPVKRYSSGMNARLGFSIAAHLEPEVLIIDEVLAVGDLSFQERAFGRIRELARSGLPVVIVSHQLDRVAELCTDAIFLRRGEPIAQGTAAEAIAAYVHQQGTATPVDAAGGVVAFDSVALDETTVVSGEHFTVRVHGRVLETFGAHIDPLLVRVRSLRSGSSVFLTSSRRLGVDLTGVGAFAVDLALQANVAPGSYLVEVSAYDSLQTRDVAGAPPVMIQVSDPGTFRGAHQLNPRITVLEHA